jgi:alkylmercury lyase
MQTISLDEAIQALKTRRGEVPKNSAVLQKHMLRLLAQGQPVTAEFDNQGRLVGSALTLIPTVHGFQVNDHQMYAWCAMDTLFLPALINQPAEVTSTCPVTGDEIRLTITPEHVEQYTPAGTVLSIVITSATNSCRSRDGFCGQIFFFSSRRAAEQWAEENPDVAIFSVEDAFRLAHAVYVLPVQHYS